MMIPITTPTRRNFLRLSGMTAAAGLLAARPGLAAFAQTAPAQTAAPVDLIAQFRAAAATTPVKVTKLRDSVYLLQGTGGNMAALPGPDGTLLIDSSVSTAAPRIKEALATLGNQPLRFLIDTHWHFDHTDGNEAMHQAGASIMAHENTRVRLSTPQELKVMHLKFSPSPAAALPQQTFDRQQRLYWNAEELDLVYFEPAHTDSDIYVHFQKANVLHVADIWFNGFYPLIDDSSGGSINGMIQGAGKAIALANSDTMIIPGHGPLGDKATLTKYHDMLTTVRDRVGEQKTSGKSLEQVVAAKPSADLDAVWGKGLMQPDVFVSQVYKTL